MSDVTETYTLKELDERDAAMLFLGGLTGSLTHLLDITRDEDSLGLVEYVNYLPPLAAMELLVTVADAADEVRHRLATLITATDAAAASAIERVDLSALLGDEAGEAEKAE